MGTHVCVSSQVHVCMRAHAYGVNVRSLPSLFSALVKEAVSQVNPAIAYMASLISQLVWGILP